MHASINIARIYTYRIINSTHEEKINAHFRLVEAVTEFVFLSAKSRALSQSRAVIFVFFFVIRVEVAETAELQNDAWLQANNFL